LDSLCAASCSLGSSAACFYKSAPRSRRRSIGSSLLGAGSLARGAISDIAGRFARLSKGVGESVSKIKKTCKTSPPLGALCDEPREAAALGGNHRYFEGTIQHPSFGAEEVELTLIIDASGEEGHYSGRWTAMGQTETVAIVLDAALGSVTIKDQCTQATVLQGSYDSLTGTLRGEVHQDGVGGGHFELEAQIARLELIDSDGDRLVFVRLLDGGIAEYCNGKLVVASIMKMRVNRGSGYCDDGSGTFTVPADKIKELHALLTEAGVAWEDADDGMA